MITNTSYLPGEVSLHYDQLAGIYRKLWGTHLHHGLWQDGSESRREACDQLTTRILAPLGNLRSKSVLDIGCGYGESARMAAKNGADVTGITVSGEQISYAKQKGGANFVKVDWLENKFASGSFDAAYSIECFSHIEDKNRFFKEVADKLKKGGRFSMSAWMSSENPGNFSKKFLLEPICREGRLPSMWNRSEIEKALAKNGLQLIESEDISSLVAKTWSESIKSFLLNLRDEEVWSYLKNAKSSERIFALTVLRIYVAYKVGSMRYGLFCATRT